MSPDLARCLSVFIRVIRGKIRMPKSGSGQGPQFQSGEAEVGGGGEANLQGHRSGGDREDVVAIGLIRIAHEAALGPMPPGSRA